VTRGRYRPRRSPRLAGSNDLGDKTLYVILLAQRSGGGSYAYHDQPYGPECPALPPRVLSTAKTTCAAMCASPGDRAVPGPLRILRMRLARRSASYQLTRQILPYGHLPRRSAHSVATTQIMTTTCRVQEAPP
jgi:hypothetical protein